MKRPIRASLWPRVATLAVATALASCGLTQQSHLSPRPEKLAAWTEGLRDTQPDDAFVLVYRIGLSHLVFVAAKHDNDSRSKTFRLIGDAYRTYHFDTVIAEGWPTSFGPNDKRILAQSAEPVGQDGFQPGGESVPTVRGAIEQGASVWGGELDDSYVKARVRSLGVSESDLLGFYVLRYIPQAISEREIETTSDVRLSAVVSKQLARSRMHLSIDPSVLPSFTAWADWYRALNGKAITQPFDPEEAGPLVGGPYRSNRLAAAISRVRDSHLHTVIVGHLNKRESVLVVFGGSHALIQQPALDAALGKPCYRGDDISAAEKMCAAPH